MPPMLEGLTSPTGMDQNAQGAGNGGGRDATAQVMGKIRDLGQSLADLAGAVPSLAPDVQQMQRILKKMITKAAQQGPQDTPSAAQLPGA